MYSLAHESNQPRSQATHTCRTFSVAQYSPSTPYRAVMAPRRQICGQINLGEDVWRLARGAALTSTTRLRQSEEVPKAKVGDNQGH